MSASTALPKQYDPSDVEPRWLRFWLESGYFHADETNPKVPYAITLPPPNVTGSLHMGHALGSTMQDILMRWRRMQGYNAMWMPGTDHASIAVHHLLEKDLKRREGKNRFDLGREEFMRRAWAWREKSGGRISEQEKLMGFSLDWERERFTMDDASNRAVREAFVRLHEQGLIYRALRMINWDPVSETVVSDLEVDTAEENGSLWEIRYPFVDGTGEIVVATTRPETMLGDTAVAVNPADPRYLAATGKQVELPLTGRQIPIVADPWPDPAFGSGAVKVTPAHDPNDYEIGLRAGLAVIQVIDRTGRICAPAPEKYIGMTVDEARTAVVADLEAAGFLVAVKDYKVPRGRSQRSGAVVEPMLMEQWFVKAGPLAEKAVAAATEGKTRFVPDLWGKTFMHWMTNIRDWCISRQLWWGHRIPAWYCDACPHITVAREAPAACGGCGGAGLRQDEDILDTWFSSALWPFSTLGWPERTDDLARFYPTHTLVTAFDILFFWVARMMMMGMHFMKEVPFDEVYIHALVRDAKGAKMSKSKGNTMDPLELIDKFGADALRFTLAAMAAQGRDIKLSEQRIEGYRNFGTKLWNASRFAQMNECAVWDQFDPKSPQQLVNKWIVGETAKAAADVTRELEARRFNEAAGALYRFVWNVYCDWYLEFIKPLLNGEDEAAKLETRRTAAWALDQILTLLHPFMPFITEEIWTRLGEYGCKRDGMLITSQWPQLSLDLVDAKAEIEINWMVELISETRSTRSQLNVPAGAKIPLLLIGADSATQARLEQYQELIDRMARLEYSTSADAAPKGSVTFVLQGATVALPLEGVVDLPAESARLTKEIAKLQSEVGKMDQKLGNADFVSRAPEEVVDELRERREDTGATVEKLSAALTQIKGAA